MDQGTKPRWRLGSGETNGSLVKVDLKEAEIMEAEIKEAEIKEAAIKEVEIKRQRSRPLL